MTALDDAAAAVLRDLDGRHEDVVRSCAEARTWWLQEWPDGAAYVLCLLAQDVQEALQNPRWPLCPEHQDHQLVVEPDLGTDPFWVCERSGLPVAPVGTLH